MIDLQLHTTDSDGTWPWNRVLEECKALRLSACAITDHDTIVRRGEVLAWAKKNQFMAIPGIELSTRDRNRTVHLLGYFVDGPLGTLQERLNSLRAARLERNRKIIKKLQGFGFSVTEEDIKRQSGGTLGRPHIARTLFEKGYVKSIQEAFDRFLAHNAAAYFPLEEMSLNDGIALLHDAGCVTVVAHPMLLERSGQELEDSIRDWKSWGLDGVEGIYPSYTQEQTVFLNRMATKHNLIITGGSDFHGENKPHIKIGVGTGQLNVPDELLDPLFKRRREIARAIGVSGVN